MKKYQKILFVCMICFLIAGNVFAVTLVPCGREGTPDCKLCHLWQLFSKVINFLIFDIAVPVSALLFVVAGVVLMTAGGNEKRVQSARTIFNRTVMGLVIIFCSWLIVGTILNTLGGTAFEGLVGAWNSFPPCP